MKENYNSLDEFVSKLEWDSESKRKQTIRMAEAYEQDFKKNQVLRHTELAEKYSSFSSQEWLEFITNKQINTQLILLERFDEELIARKLNDAVNTKLLTLTKNDTLLQKEEIGELNLLIKHLSTSTQKKTKLIKDMIDSQNKQHTFIFEAPTDRDNIFQLNEEDGGADASDSLFFILEVYDKESNDFLGFVYLQQTNLPVITKHKLSFIKKDMYRKRITILKQQFSKYTLKEHKIAVPSQVYELVEEVNVKNII